MAWLVDASYNAGHVTLLLLGARDLDPIHWTDSNFLPYHLTEQDEQGESVKKINLFTQNELTLHKVNYNRKSPRDINAWSRKSIRP